jgi:hypothetical protein
MIYFLKNHIIKLTMLIELGRVKNPNLIFSLLI